MWHIYSRDIFKISRGLRKCYLGQKYILLLTVTCQINNGLVGRQNLFLFIQLFLTGRKKIQL